MSATVISPLQEQRLADQIMREVLSSGEVVSDVEITDYVTNLGLRLAANGPDKRQPFKFFVVRDNSINAFALPGGVIGVHTGLIVAASNESEVASVLGNHEQAAAHFRHGGDVERAAAALRQCGEPNEAAAADYLVLYRRHIASEEISVMPHAIEHLTPADWEEVARVVPQGTDPLFGAQADTGYRELRRQIAMEAG